MTPRYNPVGHMVHDPKGNYVAASDYEHLRESAFLIVDRFAERLHAVERGETTADAAAAEITALANLFL